MIEFVGINDVKPQINQIEVNPWNQRVADQKWHDKYGVQIEAWAPFAEGRQDLFTNQILAEIGQQYGKTVGQVVLRWLMQRKIIALAKSVTFYMILIIWCSMPIIAVRAITVLCLSCSCSS